MKKWSKETRITIDGQCLFKKSTLSYRVLVSPVSHDVHDITRILQNELFAGHVVSNKYDGGKLIIELDDINSYRKCLQIGALRVNSTMMKVDEYTIVSSPATGEMNELWYESEMENVAGDIRDTIGYSSHPIFHLEWNAQVWKDQMKKVDELDKDSKKYNVLKHLLRVIVMLHTYGTLKKMKYVTDGKEVTLTLEKMRTIGYDHSSKLLRGTKIAENQLKTPYPSTTVKVVEKDCVVVYQESVWQGYRPLLLNMANQSRPGGGYYSGDGAQEENIFRRSDSYHSLDSQLADPNRSIRLLRTAQLDDRPFTGYGNYYPMEDFGAIYTSGATFFRGTEVDGYPYLKDPLHDVCCLAMAAYRHPKLTNPKRLDNRTAMNTRKKIENIFSIAYQQKHDCIVLSALGCGAYKNPPEHIALLFKSVISQFAGYFHTIYFAIIDDHNTKGHHNPDGNFLPFQTLLNDFIVYPPKSLRMNSATGPHRIRNKMSDGELILSDVSILDLQPCRHGNNCRDMKKVEHLREYSHPAKCPFQNGTSPCEQMGDDVHVATFSHMTRCDLGGECTNEDVEHLNDYDHPALCEDGHHCDNLRLYHLREFRHIPICADGADCIKHRENQTDHVKMFRHCKHICPKDNCCIQFNDAAHIRTALHSFLKPCPLTPYKCSQYSEFFQCKDQKKLPEDIRRHCLEYSHLCPYGRQCRTNDAQHYRTTFHIARHFCSDADKCTKLTDEDHLETYAHQTYRDIRLLCKYPGFQCQSRLDTNHQQMYRHKQNFDHLGVIPASHLNSMIHFDQNQRNLIKTVKNYLRSQDITLPNIVQDVCHWIRALQPVHKCGPNIFTSILIHGHVMSRHFMKSLKRPGVVANAVLQHNQVRSILLKHNILTKNEKPFQLIKALVMSEFAKVGTDEITTTSLDPEHETKINIAKVALQASLTKNELNVIEEWTTKIAEASIQLENKRAGIGYTVDEEMGTDKHVFGIMGPHGASHYGDIVIIFKPEIMFHPYANFSPQAATRFHSRNIYLEYPYYKDQGTKGSHIQDFHNVKLHYSIPGYEYAAALELIASTMIYKKTATITRGDVIDRCTKIESHRLFESHLPQLIPLNYIERVYMPTNLFESLPAESQQLAREAFGDSLILTVHQVNITSIDPDHVPRVADETRKPYLNFISNEINQMIIQKMSKQLFLQGTIITIPGSKFEDHIVQPLTISGSYNLYLLNHDRAPHKPEYTYIYWQIIYGDMMLTIANQKLIPNKTQSNLQCLICYIAAAPSDTTIDYHENYSYLNIGSPFQQDIYVSQGILKAKSNVFYRACNTDSFFTFCLKLNHRTGEVILSHAGPNAVYNRQKISYQFKKNELDLTKIDYIHVSAGNQDVPVRNLIIKHEPTSDLHPTFDDQFHIDTSKLRNRPPISDEHECYPIYTDQLHHKKQEEKKISPPPPSVQPSALEPVFVKKEKRSKPLRVLWNRLAGKSRTRSKSRDSSPEEKRTDHKSRRHSHDAANNRSNINKDMYF